MPKFMIFKADIYIGTSIEKNAVLIFNQELVKPASDEVLAILEDRNFNLDELKKVVSNEKGIWIDWKEFEKEYLYSKNFQILYQEN